MFSRLFVLVLRLEPRLNFSMEIAEIIEIVIIVIIVNSHSINNLRCEFLNHPSRHPKNIFSELSEHIRTYPNITRRPVSTLDIGLLDST
jgi:hypothetical protein